MIDKALAWGALAILCALPSASEAAAFKCVAQPGGRITYRDSPCDDPAEARSLTLVDNVVPAVTGGGARLSSQMSTAPAPIHGTGLMSLGPSSTTPRMGATACAGARRDYEMAVSEIKKDLQAMNRRHREAVRACGTAVELAAEHETLARIKPGKDAHSRGTRAGRSP